VTRETVERAFHRAMVRIHEQARDEVGYNANRFIQMVAELGGVETARRLLDASGVSDGFTTLWEAGRLDISVEAVVMRPEFEVLFDQRRLRTAPERLEQYGYTV